MEKKIDLANCTRANSFLQFGSFSRALAVCQRPNGSFCTGVAERSLYRGIRVNGSFTRWGAGCPCSRLILAGKVSIFSESYEPKTFYENAPWMGQHGRHVESV